MSNFEFQIKASEQYKLPSMCLPLQICDYDYEHASQRRSACWAVAAHQQCSQHQVAQTSIDTYIDAMPAATEHHTKFAIPTIYLTPSSHSTKWQQLISRSQQIRKSVTSGSGNSIRTMLSGLETGACNAESSSKIPLRSFRVPIALQLANTTRSCRATYVQCTTSPASAKNSQYVYFAAI